MKKFIFLIATFMFVNHVKAQTSVNNTSRFFYQLAQNYCSNAGHILHSADQPSERFCTSQDNKVRLKHFSTIVHEDYHIFNHQLNGGHMSEDSGERVFWLNDSVTISVPKFEVFNSRIITDYVSLDTRAKVPSYNTYLLDTYQYEHDAQRNGLLGIFEEMCAYYQGAAAHVELFAYYQDEISMTEGLDWIYYLVNASEIYAYYEFKLFISWYIQIAEEKYPDIYQQIMDNTPLKVLYTLIDLQYKETVDQYFDNREEVLNEWAAHEIGIEQRSNYLWVDKAITNSNTVGFDLPDETIRVLKNLLAKPEHEVLNKLYMEDLTLENYRLFLEE